MAGNNTAPNTNSGNMCYLFPDNPSQCDVIINVRRAMSSISLFGCVFMIFVIWLFKKYAAFAQRLILYLSIAAAFMCISYLMGELHPDGILCDFQAWWMTFFAPRVTDVDLTTAQVLWQGCRSLGSDAMVYVLQLQDKDQDYHEVYKGADTYFVLQNLQPKTDYQVRVCAIRESNDDIGDIMGAFSPGTGFVTRNPEPVEKAKPVVQDDSVTEPKQMSIQQMTAIAVGVFFLISVLIAFIIQQFIAYMTPSSRS